MNRSSDPEAGLGPGAESVGTAADASTGGSTAGFSSTRATESTSQTNLISQVDSTSPILPHHQTTHTSRSTRNTSYASILLPGDENSSSNRAYSPDPLPPSRPKWTRPFLRATSATWRFLKGPNPPIKTYIKPLFPRLQSAPSRLLFHLLPKSRQRRLLQIAFWALWLTIFTTITHWSRFRTSVGGVHANADGGGVRQLTCTSTLWWRNNACGLNGDGCKPFTTTAAMPFRCPSGCSSTGSLINPRQIGNQTIVFKHLVIGGPGPEVPAEAVAYDAKYRADSFICQAAIHAGVVSDAFGGCGLLLHTGSTTGLVSSKRNGITSAPFDASFPSTYAFARPPPRAEIEGCLDLRWHLLPISSVFTFIQALLSTQAATFFGTVFVAIFWHVGLASDPPPPVYNRNDQLEVVSLVAGRFLPAAFVMYIFYLHVLGPTWATNISPHFPTGTNKPQAPFRLPSQLAIERAIYLLLGWWIGALNNVTFAKIIPLARLTPHDLRTQPGAKPALVIIIICLLTIACIQIYYFRREGRLLKYASLYISFGVGLLLFTFGLKDMAVRIHHYILALLLLPGTKIGSRLSLLWQGLLLGLFINGAARWGFASLLETKGVLLGDSVYGSGRVPEVLNPTGGGRWEWDLQGVKEGWTTWGGNWEEGVEFNKTSTFPTEAGIWLQNVTLHWRWPTMEQNQLYDSNTGLPIQGAREFDGISILVNDVERYTGDIPIIDPATGVDIFSGGMNYTRFGGNETVGAFTWTRVSTMVVSGEWEWEKMYVRMAFTTMRTGRGVGDYTKAGVVGSRWPGGEVEKGWTGPGGGRT